MRRWSHDEVKQVFPQGEASRVKAAREAIGPDVELMLDCNNGWVDTVQAMEYLRRMEEFNPYFIEEPFGPDDVESHWMRQARLFAALDLLARGENVTAVALSVGYSSISAFIDRFRRTFGVTPARLLQ